MRHAPSAPNELQLTQHEAIVIPIRSLIIFAITIALPVDVWVTPAYAQDPAVVNSKTIRVRFENDRVRALEAICHRVPMSRCTHTPPLATQPGSIDSLNNLA